MVVALEREKVHLLLDWLYQNGTTSNCIDGEIIELLFNRETHGLKRSQLRKLFDTWVKENSGLPMFNQVEESMRKKLLIK